MRVSLLQPIAFQQQAQRVELRERLVEAVGVLLLLIAEARLADLIGRLAQLGQYDRARDAGDFCGDGDGRHCRFLLGIGGPGRVL